MVISIITYFCNYFIRILNVLHFSEEDLYPPTYPGPCWRLQIPTEKPPVWKRQWFGNSCACVTLIITHHVPAL